VEEFTRGFTCVDDARCGWLSIATCTEVKKQIDQHVRDHKTSSTDETAVEMGTKWAKWARVGAIMD